MVGYRSFVIAMKEREDRAEAIKKELILLGSHATIVEAVDGAQISESEFAELVSQQINCWRSKRILSKGELGCWLSHRRVWNIIRNENIEFAFVFEDDVIFDADVTIIAKIAAAIKDWDIIKLYRKNEIRTGNIENVDQEIVLTNSFSATSGTFAYCITKEAAKRLYLRHNRFLAPIDVELKFRYRNKIRLFDLNKDICRHDEAVSSTIEPGRRRERTKMGSWKFIEKARCDLIQFLSQLYDNVRYYMWLRD